MTQIESGQLLPAEGGPVEELGLQPSVRRLPEESIFEEPVSDRFGRAALEFAQNIPKIPKIFMQGRGREMLAEALRRSF